MSNQLDNFNVLGWGKMPTPEEVKKALPLSESAAHTVSSSRANIIAILEKKKQQLMVVVGPCSIHDPIAALDYAKRLVQLREQLPSTVMLVMRVYFEKPRTTTGWKGFINDPDLDDSFAIDRGIVRAREFLLAVNELGLACATEALDPIAPQYLGDLISWSAIGARTSESQTHREMSSALSSPVGFKNDTAGDVTPAINGIVSARQNHSFLGINDAGQCCVVRTRGNRHGHLVLRGGTTPNYDSLHVRLAEQALEKAGVDKNIVVDCSHANSLKKPELQPLAALDVVHQIIEGNQSIMGIMLESFIVEGQQPFHGTPEGLVYGCSITDACMGWDNTENLLKDIANKLKNR